MSSPLHPTRDSTQETFTDNNYRFFFGLAVDVVLRPWEKMLTGLKFTEVSHQWTVPGLN